MRGARARRIRPRRTSSRRIRPRRTSSRWRWPSRWRRTSSRQGPRAAETHHRRPMRIDLSWIPSRARPASRGSPDPAGSGTWTKVGRRCHGAPRTSRNPSRPGPDSGEVLRASPLARLSSGDAEVEFGTQARPGFDGDPPAEQLRPAPASPGGRGYRRERHAGRRGHVEASPVVVDDQVQPSRVPR